MVNKNEHLEKCKFIAKTILMRIVNVKNIYLIFEKLKLLIRWQISVA